LQEEGLAGSQPAKLIDWVDSVEQMCHALQAEHDPILQEGTGSRPAKQLIESVDPLHCGWCNMPVPLAQACDMYAAVPSGAAAATFGRENSSYALETQQLSAADIS
jgi:hypothetical protein